MVTLIIPDIHNEVEKAERLIAVHEKACDQIVLLGDYFDDFGDTPADAERVAKWLVQSIEHPRRVHLIGNHDLPYLGGIELADMYRCPGWELEKYVRVQPILAGMEVMRMRVAVEVDGWLVSHAGFHPSFLTGRTTQQVLARAQAALVNAIQGGEKEPLFRAGPGRLGSAAVGGCLWLDWRSEFEPVPGWHQVVGHTPARLVRAAYISEEGNIERCVTSECPGSRGRNSSINYCLDTRLTSAAIVDGDNLHIVE